MAPKTRSLRARFTIASMALVLLVTGVCAIGFYASQEYTEDQLLLGLMQREVDQYARAYRANPNDPPPRSSRLRSFVVDAADDPSLPQALRAVGPGIHHDIDMNGLSYEVANFTLGDKRLYLAFDITDIEKRETWLQGSLALFVAFATALAGLLGWRLSRLVLAPVTRLADSVRQLDPGRPPAGFPEHPSDHELGVIARAFDEHLRRLGEFIEREQAFTEDASHELRTPVAVVRSTVERLAADPSLAAGLRPVVERIGRAARQMEAAIEALLFLARENEPGGADLERVPLQKLAREVADSLRHLLEGRPVQLEVRVGAAAPAPSAAPTAVPRGLATLVVGNLLSNAIASTASGSIELEVKGGTLSVRDTGEGIPAGELGQVFERRFRGARSRGQGLGLHIVKRVCDRQGWVLSVSSESGRGTTFQVDFG